MKRFLLGVAVVLLLASCASAPATSGFWNANDVRDVTEALVTNALNSPRVQQEIAAMGGRTPTVLVGSFRNLSTEHIDTAIIASSFETAIFNSGRMDFVAGGGIRDEIRAEREDQLFHASEETAARIGQEVGADFMLFGTVRTIVEREETRQGIQTVRTYFVFAEMTNVETNQRIWMAENSEVTRIGVRPRNRL